MGTRAACLILFGGLLAAVPLQAHHGNTDYDMLKLVTMKVTVTGFQFINPHSLISFTMSDPKGDGGQWQGEMPAPATLARRASWTRNTLKAGDQITVIGHCAKNGSRTMQVVRVVLANGQELPGTEIPKEDQRRTGRRLVIGWRPLVLERLGGSTGLQAGEWGYPLTEGFSPGEGMMRVKRFSICEAIKLSLALSVLSCVALAQSPKPSSPPDLSGVWLQGSNVRVQWLDAQGKPLAELPMTAWGEARYKENKPTHGSKQVASAETTDPIARCLPPGVPAIYMMTYPMEILQVPGKIIMIFEYDHYVRHIYTDARPHQDLTPTWMGDSIGHWEGDALVVDATGFNDKTWIDNQGHPHSDQLHVVERFRRVDHDTMVDDITVQDPKAYTQTLKLHRTLLLRDWNLAEYICEDNAAFLGFQKKASSEKK